MMKETFISPRTVSMQIFCGINLSRSYISVIHWPYTGKKFENFPKIGVKFVKIS